MAATVVNLRTGDRDAVAIGNLCDKARGSMVESVKYLIEAGQKLTEKKKSLEHGEWMPWLKENADALGFKHQTATRLMKAADKYVVNDTFGEAEASQISKSVWGNEKSRKHKTPLTEKPLKPHYKQEEIATLAAAGMKVPEIAKETGLSARKVRDVLDKERVARAREPKIDPETLSMSAKEKLATALRQQKRSIEVERVERRRELDEEVRQRVLAEGKEYLSMLKQKEEKVEKTIALYQEWTDNRKPIFDADQFKAILMCLHPDGQRTANKLSEAFRLFNSKKVQLTGEK